MRRVSSGYTIIEVVIFLAVSLALLTSAINLISGKQGEVDFNQKMRDTQSKIQSWINDVSDGFTGGDPSKYKCNLVSGRPVVQTGGPSTTPDCVFLGKALQFTNYATNQAQSQTISAYSVFGRRTVDPATGQPPTDMLSSTPSPAAGQAGNQNLTETFSLSPAHVSSVNGSPLASVYMIGFFNSFNTEQTTQTSSNGGEDVNAYEYNFASGGDAIACLQLATGSSCNVPSNPVSLKTYLVCLTDGRRKAEIVITSSNGLGNNPTVSINYVNC